jgi:hypothetical protein
LPVRDSRELIEKMTENLCSYGMIEQHWFDEGNEKKILELQKEAGRIIEENVKAGNFKEGRYKLKNLARSPNSEVDPNLFRKAFPEVFDKLATVPYGQAKGAIGENQIIPLLKIKADPDPIWDVILDIKSKGV